MGASSNLYQERERLKEGATIGLKEALFMQSSFLSEEQKNDYASLFEASQESFFAKTSPFEQSQKKFEEANLAFSKGEYQKSEDLFKLSLIDLDKIPVTPLEAIQKGIEALKGGESQEKVVAVGKEFLNVIVNEPVQCQVHLSEALKPFHEGLALIKEEGIAKDPEAYRMTALKLWEETEHFFLNPPLEQKESRANKTVEELREMVLLDTQEKKPLPSEGAEGMKPW